MENNIIVEVQNASGDKFRVGETVAHQDETAGTAEIISFEMSESHAPEIKAITDKGSAHIDFLVKVSKK